MLHIKNIQLAAIHTSVKEFDTVVKEFDNNRINKNIIGYELFEKEMQFIPNLKLYLRLDMYS